MSAVGDMKESISFSADNSFVAKRRPQGFIRLTVFLIKAFPDLSGAAARLTLVGWSVPAAMKLLEDLGRPKGWIAAGSYAGNSHLQDQEGPWTWWDEDGKVTKQSLFKDGVEVKRDDEEEK